MKTLIGLFLLVSACVCAQSEQQQPHKSPQEIQQELDRAEAQYNRSLKIFNPYYQGPLLTPGASITPLGYGNIQGYVFVQDTYAAFNEDRHSVELKSSLINLNPAVYLSFGITPTMDGNLTIQGSENWQFDHTGGGFGDLGFTVGFPILVQKRYIPAIKFSVSETFPTGKYQHLDKFGLNSTGGGTYQTKFAISTAKLILWTTQHPVALRWYFGYSLSTTVKVADVNSYGGGPGTRGTVRPGNSFSTDLGIEVAITQRWIFCTDFVYKATNRTKFHGRTTVPVGNGSSDNLSIAPGFEYSWNPNLGILVGAWFSVYGRNSGNFATGIFSVSYSFP